MTAPVCPSLPVSRPSLGSGTEVRSLGAPQSPQTTSTTGRLVGGLIHRQNGEGTAPVSAPVSATEPKASDLLIAAFGVDPERGVYVERNGKATRGTRPRWLDRKSVRGDEIASSAWNPAAHRKPQRTGR